VIRALFGELGKTPADDLFFILNYDGEFQQTGGFSAIAGASEAEDRMALWLMGVGPETSRDQALDRALKAWAVGAMETRRQKLSDEEAASRDVDEEAKLAGFLREELKASQVEVGVLERNTARESKFRLLDQSDMTKLLKDYR
jgi:proteasome alpha subunit